MRRGAVMEENNEQLITADSFSSSAVLAEPYSLNEESAALIKQIIAEKDEKKTKELTQLFKINQNKKT